MDLDGVHKLGEKIIFCLLFYFSFENSFLIFLVMKGENWACCGGGNARNAIFGPYC